MKLSPFSIYIFKNASNIPVVAPWAFLPSPWPLHSLATGKEAWGVWGPALFFKAKEPKRRACGCKTAPGKQVETEQQ